MFAKRVAELRKELEISQAALAKGLRVGQSAVSEWERGNKIPPLEMLIRIADYFGVTIDFLAGRTDERTVNIIKAPPELESAGVEEVAVSGRKELTASEIEAIRRLLERTKD